MMSSSGGVFYHLGKKIIEEKGCVIGAEIGEDGVVSMQIAQDGNQLERLCGRKHVQAETENIYRQAEKFLKTGKLVLFSGTPCQCNALHSYLRKSYKNLYIIDIVCHGVPTQGIRMNYYRTLNENKKVESVSFRDKSLGWNNNGMRICYSDGSESFISKQDEKYLQYLLNNFSLRRSCYSCRSKG